MSKITKQPAFKVFKNKPSPFLTIIFGALLTTFMGLPQKGQELALLEIRLLHSQQLISAIILLYFGIILMK